MPTGVRKTPLYGNCIMEAPDGQVLCRTGEDKVQWYLSRGLGSIVNESPRTLRLKIEPKGRKGSDHPYMTTYKENICVVCGSDQEITRHHVVPRGFRRHFPFDLKAHCLHDVLILCSDCHIKCEEFAWEEKKRLSEEWNIPINGIGMKLDKDLSKIRGMIWTLLRHHEKIPLKKQELLLREIKDYTKNENLQLENLEGLTKTIMVDDYKTFGECLVERLPDIQDFVRNWRLHFLETMKPKFLPVHWSVDFNVS